VGAVQDLAVRCEPLEGEVVLTDERDRALQTDRVVVRQSAGDVVPAVRRIGNDDDERCRRVQRVIFRRAYYSTHIPASILELQAFQRQWMVATGARRSAVVSGKVWLVECNILTDWRKRPFHLKLQHNAVSGRRHENAYNMLANWRHGSLSKLSAEYSSIRTIVGRFSYIGYYW